ncbi:MAG TPA: hypothetical protein PLL30_14100 [Candidatus Krumholzibacteria bacterium]|nr:hypothetical protein [Candidatus Krumholzibacteria bacterium]HPD72898.1 hypothetical protein [Candidatus Krumholzibacteria bacterium]HRY41697.1 hypothetical protein [Candidatus Krumholzibacteria bacterium]
MNRHHDELQCAIARLGDHLGRVQQLTRNLAESRQLADCDLDPETDLAVVCWLKEAAEIIGLSPDRLRRHGWPQA